MTEPQPPADAKKHRQPTADEASFLLTIDEAARLLRKSRVTVYRYVNDGRITAYQVAGTGRLLFKREELLSLLVPVTPGSLSGDAEEREAEND
jgi:excisionase family DNA binding protein